MVSNGVSEDQMCEGVKENEGVVGNKEEHRVFTDVTNNRNASHR